MPFLLIAQADAPATSDAAVPPISAPPSDGVTPTGLPLTGSEGGPLGPGVNPTAQNAGAGPDFTFLLLIGGMFLVMIFFSISSGRKEKKKKAELMASLAKGSKVQTIGGILGTVVEVRDDELIVKVDENSNTRLRFAKSAITAVLS